VAIIDGGKVLVCDTPAALKQRVQRYPIFEMTLPLTPNGWMDIGKLPGVHQCVPTTGLNTVGLKVALEEEGVFGSVVQKVLSTGSRLLSLKKVEPTLEDVFIQLVGHRLSDEEEPA
jgi:ABC-2 type transport system ATP-binding protein